MSNAPAPRGPGQGTAQPRRDAPGREEAAGLRALSFPASARSGEEPMNCDEGDSPQLYHSIFIFSGGGGNPGPPFPREARRGPPAAHAAPAPPSPEQPGSASRPSPPEGAAPPSRGRGAEGGLSSPRSPSPRRAHSPTRRARAPWHSGPQPFPPRRRPGRKRRAGAGLRRGPASPRDAAPRGVAVGSAAVSPGRPLGERWPSLTRSVLSGAGRARSPS